MSILQPSNILTTPTYANSKHTTFQYPYYATYAMSKHTTFQYPYYATYAMSKHTPFQYPYYPTYAWVNTHPSNILTTLHMPE